jgi:hypothetical protein
MNFKKQAEKLENYLDAEFKLKMPVAVMPDGSLVYKEFKVKQNKQRSWTLSRIKGFAIDSFNLKACALIAARYYSINDISKYNEIKLLDTLYNKNATDAVIFRHNYEKTKDPVTRDTSLWRWEICNQNAKYAKSQITTKFKILF